MERTMKKTLLLFFITTTMTAMAQSITPAGSSSRITEFTIDYGSESKGGTVIWKAANFNVNETNTGTLGVWGDCSPMVVANEWKDNVNSNDKCLKLTCGAANGGPNNLFKMPMPNGLNLNGRRRISILYKGDGANFNVWLALVKNNGDEYNPNYDLKLGAWYEPGLEGENGKGWKRMYFNFKPYETEGVAKDIEGGSNQGVINNFPNVLVFCAKYGDSNNDGIIDYSNEGSVFYIDEVKVEDEPYADGYAFNLWGKPTTSLSPLTWNTGDSHYRTFPQSSNNGVVYLSGTWLKGHNIVNPDFLSDNNTKEDKTLKPGDNDFDPQSHWTYEYDEYRDLSWFINPETIKYYVFQNGSYLRWPDRGGLLGTNTPVEVKAGYPVKFIANRNVLVFAEKPTVISDDTPSWYDTNVVEYQGEDVWEARDLEMADDYSFVNPIPFTVKEKIMVNRSMTEGFNTIIYPFSLTAEEIRSSRVGTFYHHNADKIVYFIPTDATEANVPFVTENFSPLFEEGGINVTKVFQQFDGERTISACSDTEEYRQLSANQKELDYHSWSLDDANYNLVGTYHRISGEGKWGIATTGTYGNSDYQQTFKKGGSSSIFKPFRAYLDIPESQGAAKFAALSIADFTDDSTITGISQDVVALPSGRQDVYTLSGIRIKAAATAKELINLPKGVYIINGKKQFVR